MKLNKNIKLMYLLNLFSEMKFYGVIAILYYIKISGSMILGMSIFSISTISSSIFEIPTGIVSDRMGRKLTIVLGSFFALFSVIVLALSKNYIWLVVAAILNGIEIAFFSGNNHAYIYNNLEKENKEKDFQEFIGKATSMIYLSEAISAMLGSVLLFFSSFEFVIALSIIPKVIQVIISFFLGEIDNDRNVESIWVYLKNSIKSVFNNYNLKLQILADSINSGITEACYQFRSTFYSVVWPEWALGIPGILANIGAFFSNWFSRKNCKEIW